jgi:hypothetical protein
MMTVTLKERLRNIRHGQKVFFFWEMKEREKEEQRRNLRGIGLGLQGLNPNYRGVFLQRNTSTSY